jgi:hypothetical protein
MKEAAATTAASSTHINEEGFQDIGQSWEEHMDDPFS